MKISYKNWKSADLIPNMSLWQLPDGVKCVYMEPDDENVFSQLGLHLYMNSERTKKWIKVLPNLQCLKYLHLRGNTNSKLLDAVAQLPNLERLDIDRIGAMSLAPLSNLCQLTHLALYGVKNPFFLHDLSKLKQLKSLGLALQSSITSLEAMPTNQFPSLVYLQIGSSSETRYTVIESLEPLRTYKNLNYLVIGNIKTKDRDLSHLLSIPALYSVFISCPDLWSKSSLQAISSYGIELNTL